MIADHIYSKYDVFKRFKPLAVGIDQDLVAALPQFDPSLIARVLANHCRRPRYLKSLARGGKRFDLNNRFKGEVSPEEQAIAQQHPRRTAGFGRPSRAQSGGTGRTARNGFRRRRLSCRIGNARCLTRLIKIKAV